MFRILVTVTAAFCAAAPASAQEQPVTRAQAVAAALGAGPRAALARADTLEARGHLLLARALPNPTLLASYTRDFPQHHLSLDVPLDFPWIRSARVGAAQAARTASGYRFEFEQAGVRFDAEAAYARALAAAAHARLSRRNAEDADSLAAMARLRRDAGDAADLDVELAAVNAGQQANAAADDSVAAVSDLLELQRVMGLPADQPRISLADSLALPVAGRDAARPALTLPVGAAEADVRSAQAALALERRSLLGLANLEVGFDAAPPPGEEPRMLPVVALSLPLPLFNRNGGGIARAAAQRDRALAGLDIARRESDAAIARAQRDRALALDRARRDQRLVASADRVATMSLTAYRDGAVALPGVLEAQRNAREALARYIDDMAAANIAHAGLMLVSTAPAVP